MALGRGDSEFSNRRVLAMATGMTVTVVAWGVLVLTAIDFGRTARTGSGLDWLWLVLSTVGAVGCMFAAIILAARLQKTMRELGRSSTRPLPQRLDDLPPWAEMPGTSAAEPSEGNSSRAPLPRTTAGKRAARH